MSSQPTPNPAPQKQKPQPKKITIKQFQWYQVQTKVRQLLSELLQPFTKKQMQDTVKMNQFKRNLATMQKKLEDHDFLLTREEGVEKPTYVQLQDDKIGEIGRKVAEVQVAQNKKISDMEKVIEVYQAKIRQINQIQSRIQVQVNQRGTQNKQHKQYLQKQIQLMLQRLDTQDTEMNTLRQSTRTYINKLQTKTTVIDNRLLAVEDEIKRKTNDIKRLNDQIILMNEKIAACDLGIKDLDARLEEREKDYKLSEKFLARAIQLQNSVAFIENYLRFYQPLYTQMQISETINSFLKGSMKTRACVFEEKVFAQMHYAILNLQQDSLQAKMGDYGNRIRRIINRNKKYLIRMKIQQTYKYGNNTYQLRQLDQSLLQKSQQLQNKPPQVIVPQQQINKLIEQKWDKLIVNVENKIVEKTEPFKVWMKELQEQGIMKEIQMEGRLSELRGRVEKGEVGLELFKADMKEIEKDMTKSIEYLYKQIKRQKQKIKDLVNFSSVINHIVIQDEIDRQGLALYALRTGPKNDQSSEQNYPNIHIDEKCVACQSGNASVIVNQAFKMACLAYNPSEIKVDDKTFSREEVLEISTNILDKLKKKNEQNNQKQKIQIPINRHSQPKNRSKSSANRQLNTTKNIQSSTIDIPASSRLRDTTYLLPILGTVRKKSSMGSHREKINI